MISNDTDKVNNADMPYVRDRLKELEQVQEYEDEKKTSKGKKQKPDKEMQQFLKECDAIRGEFQKVEEHTKKIDTFLSTEKFYKFEDLQNVISPLSKDAEKVMAAINKKLKAIRIDREDIERVPSASNKMKFMQFTSLRESFKITLDGYSNVMKKYENTLEKLKTGIQRTVQGDDYDETQQLIEGEQENMYMGNYFAEKQQAEMQLRDVEERHGELLQIEAQLTEVKDLFIKIAILVEEQQESVNRAEYHAAISSRAIEMANQDLVSAKKKKKSARKIKIILIVAAAVIFVMVIVGLVA